MMLQDICQEATDLRASDRSLASRPLVTLTLLTYNQEDLVAESLRSALAQTYRPLEIIVSDDASTDGTLAAVEAELARHQTTARVHVRCNPRNLGISAHVSVVCAMASGELIVLAAGDDLSAPQRCERLVQRWLDSDRKVDLLVSDVVDMDEDGASHGILQVDTLENWHGIDDWLRREPYVIGAGIACTPRLFRIFGPINAEAQAEDHVLPLRAILCGGAATLHEPLVHYRRGGASAKRRYASVAERVAVLRRNNDRHLAAMAQMEQDAGQVDAGDRFRSGKRLEAARLRFVDAMFRTQGLGARLKIALRARDVEFAYRLRIFTYATMPLIHAPSIFLKRELRALRA
jgi:glycosyltransferase involved in cell wall biosynthesis